MNYSEEILKKVKSFGALQYKPDQIATILQIKDREQFILDLSDETTLLFDMYQSGLLSGKYNQDIQAFKVGEIEIKTKQLEYEQLETENRVYKELFHL